MMRKLSLKGKLAMGFGGVLLILVITTTVTLISLQHIAALSAAADRKAIELVNISTIQATINDQKSKVRGVVMGQKAEAERYADNDRLLADLFSKQEAMVTSDYGRQLLAGIREACEAYHRVQVQVMDLQSKGNSKEAAALLFSPEVSSLRDQVNQRISDFVNAAGKLKQAASDEQAAATSRATSLVLGLTVAGVIIGLLLALTIVRNLTGRVAQMVDMVQAISENDLSREDMIIRNHDEIGTCGKLLNQMKNRLREIIQSIAGTAEHVASASEEISSSATQQAQSAETQKDQTSQVATAMQEMASTVMQVSENSNKAAESSRQAAETARHGGAIVEETLNKMRTIAQSVGATARKMEELGKSSDQIGRIIGVIDDIADQTNLLALNAAIEAARAGEQGRGFAVVADEVRKLAERTTTATKEIAQMIKNIQDETKTAVAAMEQGTKQVEDGVKSTSQAGDSLKEIIQMSEQVGEMITHIATAATEQSSASEEVNKNMEEIAKLVKESAVGAQQSAKACQDLSGLALDLQKMVGNFKMDAGHGYHARQDHASGASAAAEPVRARAFAAGAH